MSWLWVAIAPPLQTHLPLDLTCILLVHLAGRRGPQGPLGAVALGYGVDLLSGSPGGSYGLLYLLLWVALRGVNRCVYGRLSLVRLLQVALCSLAQALPALPSGVGTPAWGRLALSCLVALPCLRALDRWSAASEASWPWE